MATKQVRQIAPHQLCRNPSNVHTHSKKQIGRIARSIQQFGFNGTIVVDEGLMILAGEGRWLAAKQLNLVTVPVLIVSGLSEAEKRAFALFDNKSTESAGWDRSGLAKELHELGPLLSEAGLDLELTGFDAPEIDSLMVDLIDCEEDPSDNPPQTPDQPVSRRGDLWVAGSHRVFCGDAKARRDLQKLIGSDRVAMVFADPPFNLAARSIQGRGKIKHNNFIEGAGELSPEEYTAFLTQALSLAARFSLDGSLHYICMDWRHLTEMMAAGRSVYTELKALAVWAKTNPGQGSLYRSAHELIFIFKKGTAPHRNNIELGRHGRNRSNVWTYPGVNTFRAGRLDDLSMHPTVKPVALVADAIRDCTRRGEIVLDPFLGSGTTVLAAERVGRHGYGLEIDPKFVDVAVRRWQAFTKRDALLQSTGRTFDEVRRDRSRRSR